MEPIIIYTDGGCIGNGEDNNIGGYGVVLKYKRHYKELKGSDRNTSNNRMEMKACIEALKAIKDDWKGHLIKLHSDSAYIVDCINDKWYVKWREFDWHRNKAKTKPVKNPDLWRELIDLYEGMPKVEFIKVKGHSGIPLNEKADELATIAMKEI